MLEFADFESVINEGGIPTYPILAMSKDTNAVLSTKMPPAQYETNRNCYQPLNK